VNAFLTTTTILFGRGKPVGGIRRYRDNGDGLSDRAYRVTEITEIDRATGSILLGDDGVNRHHLIIRNTESIFPNSWLHTICGVPHTHLPSLHRSTQFVSFFKAGFLLLACYSVPSLLVPELLFLTCFPLNTLRALPFHHTVFRLTEKVTWRP
jgi:hypothetical protein